MADITNDVTPDAMLPGRARLEAMKLLDDAKREAAEIREHADKYAADSRKNAHDTVHAIRMAAKRELERLMEKI